MIRDRKSKRVDLFGERLILAERDAYNLLEMQVFLKKNELDDDNIVYLVHASQALEDALKFSWKTVRKWRFFKRLAIRRKCRSEYLLRNLQVKELNNLFLQVLALENYSEEDDPKKKPKSGEKLQQD